MRYLLVSVLFIIFFCKCDSNNVTVDKSLEKFFKEHNVQGSFGLYDNGKGHFTIYNLNRFKDSVYLPASTFKIINSLIGLETGRIVDEKMVINWNGSHGARPECDKDLTMAEAFKLSCVPYYQEVARRIGKDTMRYWLDTLGYGSRYNKPIIKAIDSFWLNNSVKVTADEQLGLVKKLYFDQLPFQKRSMRIVRDVMVQEKNSNYTLAYKTGWGYKENGSSIGWMVGWVEENRHPYPFVLNLEGPRNIDMISVRMNILKGILKKLGFLEGKM